MAREIRKRLPLLPVMPAAQPFPQWVRSSGGRHAVPFDPADAAFLAGAALAVLPVAGEVGAWRQRLALKNAAAVAVLHGMSADEAALRDHFYLSAPGDDPGPGGRLFGAWLALCGKAALEPGRAASLLTEAFPELDAGALADALAAGDPAAGPLSAVAAVSARLLALHPRDPAPALWLADAVLARRLGLGPEAPVPLIAAALPRRALAGAGSDEAAWRAALSLAYARAAGEAFDLHADLTRRAARLLAAAPRLRAKAAGEAIGEILSRDAVSAAMLERRMSGRAARRLLDRLVALGAVRELTGRPSFRLYGL